MRVRFQADVDLNRAIVTSVNQRGYDRMKKVFGVAVFLLGVFQLGWIGYNYLIQMQPEARGRNPIIPLLLAIAFVYVGQKWFREN